jgi:hypothetical protein
VSPLLDDVGTYLIPPEKIRKHFLKEVPRGKGKHLKLIMFLQQCTVNRISFILYNINPKISKLKGISVF